MRVRTHAINRNRRTATKKSSPKKSPFGGIHQTERNTAIVFGVRCSCRLDFIRFYSFPLAYIISVRRPHFGPHYSGHSGIRKWHWSRIFLVDVPKMCSAFSFLAMDGFIDLSPTIFYYYIIPNFFAVSHSVKSSGPSSGHADEQFFHAKTIRILIHIQSYLERYADGWPSLAFLLVLCVCASFASDRMHGRCVPSFFSILNQIVYIHSSRVIFLFCFGPCFCCVCVCVCSFARSTSNGFLQRGGCYAYCWSLAIDFTSVRLL